MLQASFCSGVNLIFLSDQGKASLLSLHGQGELTAGSPIPLPNLSPNQEETQVRQTGNMVLFWEVFFPPG